MNYLIIDFETFSKNALECAVINCSAFLVNTENFIKKPYTCDDIDDIITFKLSVKDQVENYKYEIEEDTLDFWNNVSKEVKTQISPKKSDLTVTEFCDKFLEFLSSSSSIDYWFSRSNTFDPIILWRLFKSQSKNTNLDKHLKYWKVRDIRTFIDAKMDFPKDNGFIPISDIEYWKNTFVQHDSRWDVLADVLRLQAIKRAEEDLPQIER